MSQSTRTLRPRVRTATRAAAVVLAAAGLGVSGTASSQAYTWSGRSNVPVMPTVYGVQGAHYDTGSAVTGPMWRPWLFQSGPVAQRTASGTQTVKVTYHVYRWNGSAWAAYANASGSATIGSSVVSAKLPNLSYLPPAGSGYYSVGLSMVWTSAIGGVQGSVEVGMTQSGDYSCATTRPCTAGAGWVYLG